MVSAIVRKEILGSGRHGRYFAIRGVYLALLACITIPTLLTAARRIAESPYAASRTGQDFTIAFGILQFVLVVLLAPAFSIGSIAGEKASGGLDLLHAAGVGSGRIVTGKFAARMAWQLLFLASGLPLLFAGTLLGGAGAETVALLALQCVCAAALGTAVGFALSGGMRQTVPALVLAYLLLMIVYAGIPLGLLFWSEGIAAQHVPDAWYAWVCPVVSVVQYTEGNLPAKTAWLTVIPQAVLALVALGPAFLFARPDQGPRAGRGAGVDERGGRNDPASGALASVRGAGMAVLPRRAVIAGNPIAWRDARAARHSLAAKLLRGVYVGFGLFGITASIAMTLYREMPRAGLVGRVWTLKNAFNALQGDNRMHDLLRVALFVLILGAALVSLITASGVIAEERDRRALPLLKLSRLSAAEIVLGKLWGLAVYLWPVAVLPMLMTAIFFGVRVPWTMLVTGATVGAVLTVSIGAGLFFSSFMRKGATAAGIAVGCALVYGIVPPIVSDILRFGHDGQLFLAAIDPLVTVIEVIDRFGYRYAWAPYYSAERTAALTGLSLQVMAGLFFAFLSWAILESKEEAG